MKTFRILGAIFCVVGCFFALLGVISCILPLIENEQFKLIVDSFQKTSADSLTNTLNTIVVFCLRSGYFLLFCGISLTVAGGLISSSAHKRQNPADVKSPDAAVSSREKSDLGVPKPAYYPGGLTPPTVSLNSERDEPMAQVVSTMSNQKPSSISGGVEPAFSSDESDAQKLLLNDEQLIDQKTPERPAALDYSKYPSNSLPTDAQSANVLKPQASTPQKPRIVSTMGKSKG
jgi:hypothetical protein